MNFGKSAARQLLEVSAAVVVAAIALDYAWRLVARALPLVVLLGLGAVALRVASYRHRNW